MSKRMILLLAKHEWISLNPAWHITTCHALVAGRTEKNGRESDWHPSMPCWRGWRRWNRRKEGVLVTESDGVSCSGTSYIGFTNLTQCYWTNLGQGFFKLIISENCGHSLLMTLWEKHPRTDQQLPKTYWLVAKKAYSSSNFKSIFKIPMFSKYTQPI